MDTGLQSARVFSDPERAACEASIHRAGETGQPQWLARVVPTPSIDVLACYARCGDEERFYWERVEAGEAFCAWGATEEIQATGRDRFREVSVWSDGIRQRLEWIGADRPATAPLCCGGFGFEDQGSPAPDWKSFPPAHFVLPRIIGECEQDGSRWTLIVRVDPGTTFEAIEREFIERLEETHRIGSVSAGAQGSNGASLEGPLREAARGLDEGGIGASRPPISGWLPGPEYAVQSDRAHEVFCAQVAEAIGEMGTGRLEKVVLARSLRVHHDGELDVPAFLGRLRDLYPSCALFAIGRGQDTFLAATPESLVRLTGDRVDTAALAGSAPRGRTPEEDLELATALQSSEKERAEHAHVVDAIRSVLTQFCDEVEVPEAPRLRALFGIQHLETPVRGRLGAALRSGRHTEGRTCDGASGFGGPGRVDEGLRAGSERASGIIGLVEALHPTPAVAGVPQDLARDWLRKVEGLDRGWYAAPIGWLDAEGGGDFRVALRSALIRNRLVDLGEGTGSRAWLFAGAGIVDGSEPAAELAETRIKLRALLAPLTEI